MHLSLPTQILPDAAASAATNGALTAPGTAPATDAAFESFLPLNPAGAKPAAGSTPDTKGAENAAALLTAALWMTPPPATPATIPPTPENLTEGEGQPGTETNGESAANGTGDLGRDGRPPAANLAFSTATTVRSFATAPQAWSAAAKPGARPVALGGEVSTPKQLAASAGPAAPEETTGADPSAAVPTPARPTRAKLAGKGEALPPAAADPALTTTVPVGTLTQFAAPAPLVAAPAAVAPDATPAGSGQPASAPAPQQDSVITANLPAPKRSATAVAPSAAAKRPLSTELAAARGLATSVGFSVTPEGEEAPLAPLAEVPAVAAQPEPTAVAPLTEKFAARPAEISVYLPEGDSPEKKEILNAGHKTLTGTVPAVGISVAEVAATMSASASNRAKSASAAPVASVASGSVPTALAVGLPAAEAPAPAATPRETMAAVVQAVEALERHEGVSQKSVELKFQVGGEQLDLRVELKDGTVHTTFRTESVELRSALATEWRASVPAETGANVRLAEPVFNAASSHGETAFGSAGQGAPQQQQRSPQDRAPAAFSLAQEFSDAGPAESVSASSAVPAARPVSLLNAFA